MNKVQTIKTVKVLYKELEFSVIPKGVITNNIMFNMVQYVRQIGDIAFIVDGDMYFDESAYFNLTMKYCNEYLII